MSIFVKTKFLIFVIIFNFAANGMKPYIGSIKPNKRDYLGLFDLNGDFHQIQRNANDKIILIPIKKGCSQEADRWSGVISGIKKSEFEFKFIIFDKDLVKKSNQAFYTKFNELGVVLFDPFQIAKKLYELKSINNVIFTSQKSEFRAEFQSKFNNQVQKLQLKDCEFEKMESFTQSDYVRALNVIQRNCIDCHNSGVKGFNIFSPFSEIEKKKGRIKKQIVSRNMPPTPVSLLEDRFHRIKSLNPGEFQILVNWLFSDTKKISKSSLVKKQLKKLEAKSKEKSIWHLGQPDIVWELPSQKVFKKKWQGYRYIEMPLSNENELLVENAQFVFPGGVYPHHITARIHTGPRNGKANKDLFWSSKNIFFGWLPGRLPEKSLNNLGVRIPPNSSMIFEMHYEPNGKEMISRPKLGIYISKSTPKTRGVFTLAARMQKGFKISIKPNEVKTLTISRNLEEAIEVIEASVHAHYRGRSAKIWAETPQGQRINVLNMGNYSFYQQQPLQLKKPLKIPAKSKVYCRWVYDNSKNNANNPSPANLVTGGMRSTNEMMMCFLSYLHKN